mmetsp:Transcript_8797/g.14282  ORF Transcript_8797/g.14282 Transcript_8797/m.14282 type:complete len:234 (-) Transcript_8797:1679-2380(-)
MARISRRASMASEGGNPFKFNTSGTSKVSFDVHASAEFFCGASPLEVEKLQVLPARLVGPLAVRLSSMVRELLLVNCLCNVFRLFGWRRFGGTTLELRDTEFSAPLDALASGINSVAVSPASKVDSPCVFFCASGHSRRRVATKPVSGGPDVGFACLCNPPKQLAKTTSIHDTNFPNDTSSSRLRFSGMTLRSTFFSESAKHRTPQVCNIEPSRSITLCSCFLLVASSPTSLV